MMRRRIVICVFSVSAMLVGLGLWHTVANHLSASEYRQQYIGRVRDGVGDVQFANDGSSHGQVRASVESLARFLHKRSGTQLNQAAIARLTVMENRVLNGEGNRISGQDLSLILSEAVYERTAQLTNQEIDHAIETLRGFNSPDLPEPSRRGRDIIYIRADRGGPKVSEKVTNQARSFRDQALAGDDTLKYLLSSVISKEVDSRLQLLNEASTAQFAVGKDSASPLDVKLTPVQAFLVVYSVLSDDHLLDSEQRHRKHMQLIRDFRAKRAGATYPDPQNAFGFGPNGYLYSSPLDLFMGEQATDRILQLIEERSAR
jgi:hypothetical protein